MTITSPANGSSTCPTVAVAFQSNVPPPMSTQCRVDSGAFAPCTSVAQFQNLAPGPHTITVAAFNNGGHIQAQRSVTVNVLPVAPVITIDTPLDDPTFTTGPSGAISGSVTDASPLDSIVGITCTIDGTTACGGSANPAAGTFAFTFDGLLDQHTGGAATHTVAIAVTDRCSAQGATVDVVATETATWHVDSTPSSIAFTNFDDPFVASGAAGPADDITNDNNRLHFTVTTPPGDEPPLDITVTVGGMSSSPNCFPTSPTQLDCTEDLADLPAGFNTATVETVDPYNNEAEAELTWQVDDAAPAIVFFNVGTNGCETTAGLPMKDSNGSVQFAMVDDLAGVAQAMCTLDLDTGGGAFVPVVANTDCTSGTFAFSSLADGEYRLTVTVSDGVNNTGASSTQFAIDGTAPTVTFVSPAGNDIVAPDVTPTGTFATVSDPASVPPVFMCTLDGTVVPCDETNGYDISPLVEGSHTVQIAGTDCVGNTSVAAIAFQADTNAPFHSVTLIQSDSDGNADLQINANDAITNIERIDCLLDGPPGSTPSVPCNVNGLPTVHGVELLFSSVLSLSELSPGVHRLRTVATDFWGHRSDVHELVFLVTYLSDTPGHVYAIGRDYESEGAGTPAGSVLGNAVFTSRASAFARPMHVVLADPTNSATELSAQQVEAAICQRLEEREGCVCSSGDCVTVTHATDADIGAALLGQDAVVFLDQDDVGGVESIANSGAFINALTQFANSGGIVIATNGVDGAGTPSNTYRLVNGLVDLSITDAGADPEDATRMCESQDPVTYETFDTFIESLPASTTGVRFTHTALDNVDVYTSPGADGLTRPVVIDKYFPQPFGRGPVHVRAFDDFGDSFGPGLAVFVEPGQQPVTCAVGADGAVSREIVPGTIVTVSSDNDAHVLQTLFDLAPYESVILGRSIPPATPATVDVSWPAVMGATHYTVSTGCDTVTVVAPTLTATLEYSTDCLGNGFGVAFTAGLPTSVFATGFVAFVDGDLNADLATWTLRSPTNMLDVSVAATPAFDASTDPFVADAQTSFSLARGNVLFGASVPAIGASAAGAVPVPNPFTTGSASLLLDFETGDSGFVSVATLASTAIQATAFLPRLTSFVVTGAADARTIVFGTSKSIWSGAPITPLSLADADGMQVRMQTTTGTCSEPMEWRFSLAPPNQQAFALPPLGNLPCVPDDTNATFGAVMFSSHGRQAAHAAMQDMIDRLAKPFPRPIGQVTRASQY